MADDVAITPGSGATVAADDVGGVLYQRVKVNFGDDGSRVDVSHANPLPITQGVDPELFYAIDIPLQVHVAAATTVHWDLFNADAAKLVRVLSVKQRPGVITAVTGVATAWRLSRTTSVGTGGSAANIWLPNTGQTALDADVTCRTKPTGGAAEGTVLRNYEIHSEETNAGTIILASQGGLELLPPRLAESGQGLLLRQNEGLCCIQATNSNAGNTGWNIIFTVE